jgi:hypothetical protein
MLGIEMDDPPHRSDIEKNGIGGELLAAHRVASACHAHRLAFRARGRQSRPQRGFGVHRHDAVDAGRIDLRMDVIDDNGCFGAAASQRKKGEPSCSLRDRTKGLASCRHLRS